jgi:hypothetical protein
MQRVRVMLGIIGVMYGLLLSGATQPVQAQFLSTLPFVLYDDFPDGPINPDKWALKLHGAGGGLYEVRRDISTGQLQTELRLYGGMQGDEGVGISTHRLIFRQDSFLAVKFDATVSDYEVTDCAPSVDPLAPAATPSLVRLVFLASLFNDGTSTGPGDQTGDVEVRLEIGRDSDSLEPSDVFKAEGLLSICTDPACVAPTVTTTGALLGQVPVGQPQTFAIGWDLFRNQVVFQKNAEPEVALPYSQPVVARHATRQLATQSIADNCTTGRTVAAINAAYDNVMIFDAPF